MTPSFLHEAQRVAEQTTPHGPGDRHENVMVDVLGVYHLVAYWREDVATAALRHLAEKLTRAEARIAALRAGVDAIFARGRDYGFACEWCRIAEAARDADENVAALSSPAVPSFPSDEDMFAQAKVFCAAQGIDLDTLVHDAAVAMRDRTPGRFVFDETLPFADEPKEP